MFCHPRHPVLNRTHVAVSDGGEKNKGEQTILGRAFETDLAGVPDTWGNFKHFLFSVLLFLSSFSFRELILLPSGARDNGGLNCCAQT